MGYAHWQASDKFPFLTLWSIKPLEIIVKNLVRTSQKRQWVSPSKISQLTLLREAIFVYYDNNTTHVANNVWGNSSQSVCPSIRMEQLGSHWTSFYEILYFFFFQKSVKKTQVWLKSDKNNGYFTWRPTNVYDRITPVSSSNEKFFRQTL
jgi:hypothetical protein